MPTLVQHIKVLAKADPDRLGNEPLIKQAMADLVKLVQMQPLGEPVVHNVPLEIEKLNREKFEDEGGITTQRAGGRMEPAYQGIHTLSTSHVAIHTWPLREEFKLDIFSCREYDADLVVGFLTEVFHITHSKVTDLSASCEWD